MYKIYNEDCLIGLKKLENESIDMVLTSPPYDKLRNYGGVVDNWNFDFFKQVANELYRVVKVGGVVVWVVGDATVKGSETGTSFKQALYFKEIGFNIHDTMIYRKLNYAPQTHNRYEQEFEYMFCFSKKNKPKTFNPIKIPCKWAGTETWGKCTYYNPDDTQFSKPKKVINDTKIKGNIFEYHTGSTTASGKIKHPAMFPLQLAIDQIQSWSNEGDLILDPFIGSGTTALACKELNRDCIGYELNKDYFDITMNRLNGDINGINND